MSTNTEFSVFETLDLAPIKNKLMHVESGEGWSERRASAVEAEYRRFLFLMKKYPDGGASPSVDVDTFWHYHILDTMKYARDCEASFGYFLHHYPYVGMGAGDNQAERERAGERMREIYEAEFGVVVRGDAAWCASAVDKAWCASPNKQAAPAADSAWCASAVDQAWCASPGKQAARAADSAWCASAVDQAWCASPGKQAARGADSAWCASAVDKAWCASPGKPSDDSVKGAWCASPGKPLQAA